MTMMMRKNYKFFNINGFSFGTDRGYGEYQFLILCDENFRRQ